MIYRNCSEYVHNTNQLKYWPLVPKLLTICLKLRLAINIYFNLDRATNLVYNVMCLTDAIQSIFCQLLNECLAAFKNTFKHERPDWTLKLT